MLNTFIIGAAAGSRRGLTAMLAGPGIVVTGDAASVGEWLRGAQLDECDVVVLADSDALNSLDHAAHPRCALVVLAALRAGVDPELAAHVATLKGSAWRGWALLDERGDASELRAAVMAAHAGLVVLSPSAAVHTLAATGRAPDEAISLTSREQEILELVSRGQPNKAIAAQLGISESTVKFHLTASFEKLGAASRAEAVSTAARRGLITL